MTRTQGLVHQYSFTDFGFERLFGTAFNRKLLIVFLNQVRGKAHIKELTYWVTE